MLRLAGQGAGQGRSPTLGSNLHDGVAVERHLGIVGHETHRFDQGLGHEAASDAPTATTHIMCIPAPLLCYWMG